MGLLKNIGMGLLMAAAAVAVAVTPALAVAGGVLALGGSTAITSSLASVALLGFIGAAFAVTGDAIEGLTRVATGTIVATGQQVLGNFTLHNMGTNKVTSSKYLTDNMMAISSEAAIAGLGYILMSKTRNERPDSGLRDIPTDEISRRARDKSLSGEERRKYQKEEKIRKERNKQKRQSNFSIELDLDTIGEIVGLSGTALIIYLIISEGSRLFPPRNLIPVP